MRVLVVGAAAVLLLAGCETMSRSDLVASPQVCVATTLPVYFAEGEAGQTRFQVRSARLSSLAKSGRSSYSTKSLKT